MDFLLNYILPFLVILTIVVYVHEMGHYLVARWNNVKVEVFSIGFGPEIFGFYDRAGTRWKFSAIPLGGYVKMFGDADAASRPGETSGLSDEEKAVSFPHKRLGQRFAVVAAGPAANFLFAIVIFAGVFMFVGQPTTPPVIGGVQEDSPAAEAGLAPGDRIVRADRARIDRFEDIQREVQLSAGQPMRLVVERDGEQFETTVTPRIVVGEDRFGNERRTPMLGISVSHDVQEMRRMGPGSAILEGGRQTYVFTAATLRAVGQMITGTRTTEELGGPIRIAQFSGQAAQTGFLGFLMFLAILSINLGLINLFPIPMLDGGHLLFYTIEAVRGRPLGERAQEYGFRIGLALVFALMIFATWNDLTQLRVWDYLSGIVS